MIAPGAGRLLAASDAALIAGQPVRAGALLEEATPNQPDPLARAQGMRLDGAIRFALGQAGEAAPVLLEAARVLAPTDARGGREALLEAVEAALFAGSSASRAVLAEIAAVAPALPAAGGGAEASVTDLLLEGFAAREMAGDPASVPLFQRAVVILGAGELSPAYALRWLALGYYVATELIDDQAQHTLVNRWVRLARDQGALTTLPVALSNQGSFAVVAGQFDAARACFAEASEISTATGNPGVAGTAGGPELYELAWRGREADTRRVAAVVAREAACAARGSQYTWVQHCLALLELSLGNYQAALQSAVVVYEDNPPFFGAQVLPDLVEAAARCGETEPAEGALRRLAERALAADTPRALGLLARSRALLASDADAEPLYEQALVQLGQCRARPQLARAHLLYGEWLRRQRHRCDARQQLRVAHDMLTSMGAAAFAERARAELLAAGERARQPAARTAEQLTPQEAQIAALVSQGESNRDIAAQLFLSPSTVDYHLRKVFRKRGVASRTQLARTMTAEGP